MKFTIAKESIAIKASAKQIMTIYQKVSSWPKWDEEIECVELDGLFMTGTPGRIKTKGGPWVNFFISKVSDSGFDNTSHLPLARLKFSHDIKIKNATSLITHLVTIEGPLAFLFYLPFKNKISHSLSKTLESLKKIAEGQHDS